MVEVWHAAFVTSDADASGPWTSLSRKELVIVYCLPQKGSFQIPYHSLAKSLLRSSLLLEYLRLEKGPIPISKGALVPMAL